VEYVVCCVEYMVCGVCATGRVGRWVLSAGGSCRLKPGGRAAGETVSSPWWWAVSVGGSCRRAGLSVSPTSKRKSGSQQALVVGRALSFAPCRRRVGRASSAPCPRLAVWVAGGGGGASRRNAGSQQVVWHAVSPSSKRKSWIQQASCRRSRLVVRTLSALCRPCLVRALSASCRPRLAVAPWRQAS
jgi:hypothetical protein